MGAPTLQALSPKVRGLVQGVERRPVFVGEEEDFAGDAEFHGEPVKVDEGWGDVLLGLVVGETPGS